MRSIGPGELRTYVPEALHDSERRLDELFEELLPASHAALEEASRSLFFSLPVAFDPARIGRTLSGRRRSGRRRPAVPVSSIWVR